MRENRTSGSEGGEAQTNELSLPLSLCHPVWEDDQIRVEDCGRTLRWSDDRRWKRLLVRS